MPIAVLLKFVVGARLRRELLDVDVRGDVARSARNAEKPADHRFGAAGEDCGGTVGGELAASRPVVEGDLYRRGEGAQHAEEGHAQLRDQCGHGGVEDMAADDVAALVGENRLPFRLVFHQIQQTACHDHEDARVAHRKGLGIGVHLEVELRLGDAEGVADRRQKVVDFRKLPWREPYVIPHEEAVVERFVAEFEDLAGK